jgi:D-serine deaminase-like pyridoxal phosphate-dependent protein
MTQIADLDTPAALVDTRRMQDNIDRMQARMDGLGVKFRPHVKTSKCLPVVQAQLDAGARGITVSTLKEAEQFFDAGIDDILYAVCIAPARLPRALALRRRGCDLKLVTDSVAGAEAIARFGKAQGEVFEAWIEIDADGNRSGIPPEGDALLAVGRASAASWRMPDRVTTTIGPKRCRRPPSRNGRVRSAPPNACARRACPAPS